MLEESRTQQQQVVYQLKESRSRLMRQQDEIHANREEVKARVVAYRGRQTEIETKDWDGNERWKIGIVTDDGRPLELTV